ncbi:YMGG-like glycine zipper-containing protein [Roseibacillus ishigakijimensis]|uniref:YMGG-like Gly-zipper domain-containing protein n=1 Tax=Roseibacillus ishigakijimensis TaxID=454146 RepID=A0A934VHP5_9BACT|nr:YMGG-like glycine zipper-containing protein [Roseibacillus ishigakijimensis]MBK1834198.1 hypothetical protein [Roseibacillus ishigakijimensis]
MKKTMTTAAAALSALALSNCAPQNNMQRDAAVGAAGGAILGGIIGNNVGDGNAARGAVIGGLLGGAGGAAVGNNKDLQQGRGYTLQQQNPYYGQQQVYPQQY